MSRLSGCGVMRFRLRMCVIVKQRVCGVSALGPGRYRTERKSLERVPCEARTPGN